jgi:hypothetical protein
MLAVCSRLSACVSHLLCVVTVDVHQLGEVKLGGLQHLHFADGNVLTNTHTHRGSNTARHTHTLTHTTACPILQALLKAVLRAPDPPPQASQTTCETLTPELNPPALQLQPPIPTPLKPAVASAPKVHP